MHARVGERTVNGLQQDLLRHSHRSVDPKALVDRMEARRLVLPMLHQHYRNKVFSAMKWMAYNGYKRCEDRWMNDFTERYGAPGSVLVVVGDFSVKGRVSVRFHAPTPLRSIITRFKKAGHHVVLANEAYTSKFCSNCRVRVHDGTVNGEVNLAAEVACCETFLEVLSPRPWKSSVRKRHGVTKCNKCRVVYNRDRNACQNIMYIALAMLYLGARPPHLPSSPSRFECLQRE
jgi:hypothetical protein